MLRSEKKNVAGPKSEEYVLLNCIYVKTFTAMDQLSIDRFDVEHIAPKDQVRKLIEACNGDGLPISCIANLCYLPESANRSKGTRNFYQDNRYRAFVDLEEVERKYSFTESEDLEWMEVPYERPEDFAILREYYTEYCTKRFEKLKHLFCESLGIQYVSMDEIETDTSTEVIVSVTPERHTRPTRYADKCIQRLADSVGEDLVKLSRGSFKTKNGEYGYALAASKVYKQGRRDKFWFAYRKTASIANCEKRYYVFGCGDEATMIKLPISLIEENLDKLNVSTDVDGNITHWHIVLFKNVDGHMTWLFSKPSINEMSIDDYLM